MKFINIPAFIIILAVLSGLAEASHCQDIYDKSPVLRYVEPDSSLLVFFNWEQLRSKGLTWKAFKGFMKGSDILKGVNTTNDAVFEKAFEDPRGIGINDRSDAVLFTLMTNLMQPTFTGIAVMLEDPSKFAGFAGNLAGFEFKNANIANYAAIADNILAGWNESVFIILKTDNKDFDLRAEMEKLLFSRNTGQEFSSRPGLNNLYGKSPDISIWIPVNLQFLNSIMQLVGITEINLEKGAEFTMSLLFLPGQLQSDIFIYGVPPDSVIMGEGSGAKVDPSLFRAACTGNILGFLAARLNMNNIKDKGSAGKMLSSYGLTSKDMTEAFSGDFLLFLTDNGRTNGDIELGTAANIRNGSYMNRLIARLERSGHIVSDPYNRNVYMILKGDPSARDHERAGGFQDNYNNNTYIVIKNDKFYLAAKPLKDSLLSENAFSPGISPELTDFADKNLAAGYIDTALLVEKIKPNPGIEGTFMTALTGNFLNNIKMTANEAGPGIINMHFDFNMSDAEDNSLKAVLDRIEGMKEKK